MISLKKAIAGLLLIIGLPVIVFAALESRRANQDTGKPPKQTTALMVLGLVPTAIGGLLFWGMHDDARRDERDRLRTAFFQLVKAGNGRISATDFSIETGLAPSEARLYLDDRARYFHPTLHIDDENGIIYHFQLGFADPTLLLEETSEETLEPEPLHFTVLLRAVAPEHEEEILQVLQEMMNGDADTIKEVLGEPLVPVQIGVPLAIAQDSRQRLEAVGAKVLVALE